MPGSPAGEWGKYLTGVIGMNVARHRKRRGVTGKDLARMVSEATGKEMRPAVLSTIETGARDSIGVAEVFAIAAALHVPPAVLLVPLGAADTFEAAPGYEMTPARAYQWLTGERGLWLDIQHRIDDDDDLTAHDFGGRLVTSERAHLQALETLRRSSRKRQRLLRRVDPASAIGEDLAREVALADTEIASAVDNLVAIRKDMIERDQDRVLPPLPEWVRPVIERRQAEKRQAESDG